MLSGEVNVSCEQERLTEPHRGHLQLTMVRRLLERLRRSEHDQSKVVSAF
jgi:hypothetical protein